jgi:hypothetical protein
MGDFSSLKGDGAAKKSEVKGAARLFYPWLD